jgi:hypothetical protein
VTTEGAPPRALLRGGRNAATTAIREVEVACPGRHIVEAEEKRVLFTGSSRTRLDNRKHTGHGSQLV